MRLVDHDIVAEAAQAWRAANAHARNRAPGKDPLTKAPYDDVTADEILDRHGIRLSVDRWEYLAYERAIRELVYTQEAGRLAAQGPR